MTKYLFSYVLMLLIPILVITVVMFQINFSLYRSEIVEKADAGVENICQIIDVKTDELMTLALQAFSNSVLAKVDDAQFIQTMQNHCAELSNYVSTNNYIKEMAMYYPERGYVASSQSPTSMKNYAGLMYQFGNYTPEQFQEFLDGSGKVVYLPVRVRRYEDSNVLHACVIKESAVYGAQERVAIIILEMDYIKNLAQNISGDFYVFDADGTLLTQNTPSYGIDRKTVWEAVSAADNQRISLNGDRYYANRTQSSVNGWNYVLLLDYDEMFRGLVYIQWIYMLVLVLIVVAGSVVLSYSLKYVYNPIRNLASHLELSIGGVPEDYDEIEAVRFNVNHLVKTKDELEKRVENAYEITRDYMLYRLINGVMHDEEEIRKKLDFYGVSFRFPYYYIAIFSIDEFAQEIAADALTVLDKFAGERECVLVNLFEDNKICLICPATDKAVGRDDAMLIADIQHFLEEIAMSSVTVGVGTPVERISTLWKSYIEAKSAHDYRIVKGMGRIIPFGEISARSDDEKSPKRCFAKIATYIKAGELKKTFELIDEVVDSLHDVSLHAAKCICFEMIMTIVAAVSERMGSNREDDEILSRFDITALVEFESVGQLVGQVKVFLDDVFRESVNQSGSTDSFIDKIVAYISENYNKSYFSVEHITDHFGVSTTYLNQYFKSKKGMKVSNYITKLQIDNTKRLLVETDMSIKEIAAEIGYTDVSNFIRKFKAQTGVTPGIYRKANKKG